MGGALIPALTAAELAAVQEWLELPQLCRIPIEQSQTHPDLEALELKVLAYLSDGPYHFCKIFNDKGAAIKLDRGRYQCELSEQAMKRNDLEDQLHELLLAVHAQHLAHLGHAWDHAVLFSSTQSPIQDGFGEWKPRAAVQPQKRHRDIDPELELDGELVAPGAHIAILGVMPNTALDVWVPSRACLVRVPIPLGHLLVLPASTVHRGIGFGLKGLDCGEKAFANDPRYKSLMKLPVGIRLHCRIHWYICRHGLEIPDGLLNSQTDWELLDVQPKIPVRVDCMQHGEDVWP